MIYGVVDELKETEKRDCRLCIRSARREVRYGADSVVEMNQGLLPVPPNLSSCARSHGAGCEWADATLDIVEIPRVCPTEVLIKVRATGGTPCLRHRRIEAAFSVEGGIEQGVKRKETRNPIPPFTSQLDAYSTAAVVDERYPHDPKGRAGDMAKKVGEALQRRSKETTYYG